MKKGKTRKIIAFLLAAVMVLAMCIPAMAADNYTITVNNAKNGETYTAYKIFDASYASETDDAVSYTANKNIVNLIEGKPGAEGLTFKQIGTTDEYVVTVDKDTFNAAKAEEFAKLLDSVKDKLTAAAHVTAADGKAEITGLSKGYYFVDTTLGSLCALDTAKNVTVEEKNTIPSEEKTVSDTENGTYGSNANAQIGDTVYYQIQVTDSKGTDQAITVHDTMSKGLSLNTDSFTVTKDGETVPKDNYSVKTTGLTDVCTFEVTLNADYVKNLEENDVVVIKYSATLNENAVAGKDETNTSKLTYSNQTTTESTPKVHTYKFQVNKYDGADSNRNPLAGAKFKLLDKDGNLVKLVKANDAGTEYRVAKNENESGAVNEFVTVDSGNITITGVDADEGYSIEETEAPAGYNKLTGAVSITVNADNSLVQPVENNKGTALPSTGGRGTRIFYLVGIICVAGAGIVLVSRRRMSR
ncbi:SpaH/EbpB family LPXTG-anchored major pilin [Clostridium sp. SY8519]|uniref:SpaH/EbpB family LPXTG-anchored major pilin n=1 Tax=Clostridium sp. (strain SY8519) TaxID=1042156 RepID=UPI0002E64877|nr:SpaH/EbpB family LPXTG-anchored major pilin [Clostridium sp. SY8519]